MTLFKDLAQPLLYNSNSKIQFLGCSIFVIISFEAHSESFNVTLKMCSLELR